MIQMQKYFRHSSADYVLAFLVLSPIITNRVMDVLHCFFLMGDVSSNNETPDI